MKQLTPQQQEALDLIAAFIRDHGYAPTYREIATGLRLADHSSAQYYVKVLERKGYIVRDYASTRTIRLVRQEGSQ